MRLSRAVALALICFFAASSGVWFAHKFLNRSPMPSNTFGFADLGDANIFVDLSRKIVPSVVNISTLTSDEENRGSNSRDIHKFFEDMFRFPGPGPGWVPRGQGRTRKKNKRRVLSKGTGFVIDKSGLILTNNHVVAEADEIRVRFTEEKSEQAVVGEVVGRDPELDLALIQVKTDRKLVPVQFGDSDKLEVGEYVLAVGNPFGQGHSVTHGIISATNRDAPDFPLARYLQTDAPINPGNSGGPLVNLEGQVIGINNAIDQRAQGIGFAIPSNLVKQVLPQLREEGMVSRGYIGVLITDLTPEVAEQLGVQKDLKAPMVTQVSPGQPAAQAGLKPFDIVESFNGKRVFNTSDLIASVTGISIGKRVPVVVRRKGDTIELKIEIGKRPGTEVVAAAPKPRVKTKKESNRPLMKRRSVELGMELETLTTALARDMGLPPKTAGVVVTYVEAESPADAANIFRGDVILSVEDTKVINIKQFYDLLQEERAYLLRVLRVDPTGQDTYLVPVLNLSKDK